MPRNIYLAVYSNGRKPAHWAIWIPSTGKPTAGKMIHVTGNPATGFFLEFKRNYDFDEEDRRYQIISLATVEDRFIVDVPGAPTQDTIARDRLESTATVVPPPGKSANPFDPAALNCQNWIASFIDKLVADGYLNRDARMALMQAPAQL